MVTDPLAANYASPVRRAQRSPNGRLLLFVLVTRAE